ncbi:DotU family type IV/VI secretion system protein [Paraburkholderia sp. SOS3]|jgi:type VI secretion system protein ImpK|uniref:DotU family type IV/VI secretion system protein n=1 Tax=Paraburkholderia sp. SOS3 TaxID=1926494 RepID=UPI000947758A|nr:DotU family type IV/VI secretion system protein [Paraburkholderia sp. SOS3]APR35978.1 DotU family type IV / VI secretion system protein [Paraburkholderia sp. SOS3]
MSSYAAANPTVPLPLLPVALRDTALTVTALAGDAMPTTFDTFRRKCVEQVERLRSELTTAGHPRDVIEDAAYAQCALLDEAALSSLKGVDRNAWEREPLQVSEFQSHDAGEELIARIERRLAQPQPVLPLLAIFAAVLDLGFRGKFALDGRDARAALMRTLDERLGRHGESSDTSGPVVVRTGNSRRRFSNLSPLAWVVIATVCASVIYVALDQWLTASIARITH